MELLQSLLTLQLRNLILIYNYFNRALLLLNVKLLLCLLYLILLGFDLELIIFLSQWLFYINPRFATLHFIFGNYLTKYAISIFCEINIFIYLYSWCRGYYHSRKTSWRLTTERCRYSEFLIYWACDKFLIPIWDYFFLFCLWLMSPSRSRGFNFESSCDLLAH